LEDQFQEGTGEGHLRLPGTLQQFNLQSLFEEVLALAEAN
jgi:hypothetical protein